MVIHLGALCAGHGFADASAAKEAAIKAGVDEGFKQAEVRRFKDALSNALAAKKSEAGSINLETLCRDILGEDAEFQLSCEHYTGKITDGYPHPLVVYSVSFQGVKVAVGGYLDHAEGQYRVVNAAVFSEDPRVLAHGYAGIEERPKAPEEGPVSSQP